MSVRHIGVALGVGPDTLRHRLPPQYKRKEIQEKKSILMTLMMTLNYSLQYLVSAGSY